MRLFLNVRQQCVVNSFLVASASGGDFLLLKQPSGQPHLFLMPICAARHGLTSGFSPWAKNCSSPFLFSALSRVKYPSSPTFSTTCSSIPFKFTFDFVVMTYLALTRLNGTPLILKGPVTRRTPWGRCLRRMTRLPRKRPARRISTLPGFKVERGRAG